MKILPFRPIMRDLAANFWHLRTFLLLLLIVIVVDGILLFLFEDLFHSEGPKRSIFFWILLSVDDVFPPQLLNYTVGTEIGTVIRKLNGLLGYVLLGLVFHAIRESFRGHNLRASKRIFLTTEEEAR